MIAATHTTLIIYGLFARLCALFIKLLKVLARWESEMKQMTYLVQWTFIILLSSTKISDYGWLSIHTSFCLGITLKFVGRSSVRWTETEHKTDSEGKSYSTQVMYSNAEQYFSHEMYIFGNGNKTSLPAGVYNFPFSFVLPKNIPSSFEGIYSNKCFQCFFKVYFWTIP